MNIFTPIHIQVIQFNTQFKQNWPQVQQLIAVRGSYADAAIALHEDWVEALSTELGFDWILRLILMLRHYTLLLLIYHIILMHTFLII